MPINSMGQRERETAILAVWQHCSKIKRMSLARICSNTFTAGLRTLGNYGIGLQTMTNRNLHMLQRPIIAAGSISIPASLPAVLAVQRLLQPFNSLLTQVAGFKVKGRLRRRCKDCYFVIRQERHYVICPTHRRHKQMSMKKRDYKSWILTHATQSKERPY